MFLMPHEDESIIGTTDDDYYGDPDDLEATNDEVEYLLEGAASLVPGVRNARITRAWCGLRTTHLRVRAERGRALPRAPAPRRRRRRGSPGSSRSSAGSSRATARRRRRRPTGSSRSSGGRPVACRTHEEPLPGGDEVPDPARARAEHGLDRRAGRGAARLPPRRAAPREVLRLVDEDPRLGLVLCRDEGILAAEVVHCARHEKVRRLQDLRRRCRVAARRPAAGSTARGSRRSSPAASSGWYAGPDRARSSPTCSTPAGASGGRSSTARQLVQEELVRGAHAACWRCRGERRAIAADVLVVGGGMAGRRRGARGARARRGGVVLVAPLARARPRSRPARSRVAPDLAALPGEPLAARAAAARGGAAARASPGPTTPTPSAGRGAARRRRSPSPRAELAAAPRAAARAPPLPRDALRQRRRGRRSASARRRRAISSRCAGRSRSRASAATLAFDAPLVAAGLARYRRARRPARCARSSSTCPGSRPARPRPHELALALDAPGAAEALGDALRRGAPARARARRSSRRCSGSTPAARVAGADRASGPACRSRRRSPTSRACPGSGCTRALEAALAAAGVEVVAGDLAAAPGRASRVAVGGREVRARGWVLATGRFVGGGIVAARRPRRAGAPAPGPGGGGREAGVHLARRPAASLTVRDRRRAAAAPLRRAPGGRARCARSTSGGARSTRGSSRPARSSAGTSRRPTAPGSASRS